MRIAVPVAALLVVTASAATAHTFRHLRLVKASPAADGTVAKAPAEIRLWFSEEPNLKATSIRVTDGSDRAVETASPAADEKDGRVVHATVKGAVAPGTYTVAWRTTSDDGHVVRGDFRFTYRAAAGGEPGR